jgi:hypothetical protein
MLITIRFTDARVGRDTHCWQICGLISRIGEREHYVDDGFATSLEPTSIRHAQA